MTTTLPTFDTLKANPDWPSLPLFDRTGWTRVRFGDVVMQCKEKVGPVVLTVFSELPQDTRGVLVHAKVEVGDYEQCRARPGERDVAS